MKIGSHLKSWDDNKMGLASVEMNPNLPKLMHPNYPILTFNGEHGLFYVGPIQPCLDWIQYQLFLIFYFKIIKKYFI